MALVCRWEAGFISLWTFVVFTNGQDKAGLYFSMEDQPDPKCLARTLEKIVKDFTCFFKTEDNETYDFYYTTNNPPKRTRCEMMVQKSQDGGFLHICSFPQSHIFLFDEIPLEVVDRNRSITIHSWTVTVEDNILPEPPSNMSIMQNDHIGELKVSWQAKCAFNMYYKIRYSSKSLDEIVTQGLNKFSETLVGLVPGEEVKVQVSLRCSPNRNTGHWSHWSEPVRAVVPQTADDISLICYTPDLFSITCQWDNSEYNADTGYILFYQMRYSNEKAWTQWTECFPETNLTDQCRFYGDMHQKIRVKLSRPSAPLSTTLYKQDMMLNNIIKTPPPSLLRQNDTDKLCLNWESPLVSLSSHLQYEVSFRVTGEKQWMTVFSNGPETTICLKLPWDSHFNAKIRAEPHGPMYSGHWSDWSDELTGEVPAPQSSPVMLLVQCSPIMLLVIAVIFTSLFYKYFSKLKHYFWPPVPNLDKVLQEFLTDPNHYKWDPPVMAKQCYEETTSSVVVVLSKDEDSGLEEASEKSSGLLSSSGTSYFSVGQEDGSIERELYPDYVALNKNTVIHCSKENSYIYEDLMDNIDEEIHDEFSQNAHSSFHDSLTSEHYLGSDFSNNSYLPMVSDGVDSKDTDQRGHGNIYTNLPCC